jgi:GTPase SAR1 family protein
MHNLSGQPLLDNPLDAPLFVDRDNELLEAIGALSRRINVLLLGQRGIGKTSFLYRVQRELRSRDLQVVYLAGHALAETAADLLSVIRYHLAEPQTVTINPLANVVSSLMLPRSVRVVPEGERMLQEVQGLRDALANRAKPAVVLLDEMPSKEEARKLFARMRDEVWRLPIAWLVAANNSDAETYLKPPADAFFGRVIRLGPLSNEAIHKVLQLRVPDLDTSTIDTLVQQAAGNPRRLISLAQDVAVRGGSADRLAAEAQRIRERLRDLGEPAQRLYAELEALGQASPSDEELLRRLGWKRSRAQQVMSQLEQAGLILANQEAQDRGGPRKVFRPRPAGAE